MISSSPHSPDGVVPECPSGTHCKNGVCVPTTTTTTTTTTATGFKDGAPRYWPKFGGARDVRLLDGPAWDYDFIDGWDSGFDSMSPTFKPSDATLANKTAVPSCSDLVAGGAAGYLGPRGVALYKTSFTVAVAAPVRLQFQSCSFYCRVWVNGQEVQPPAPEGLSADVAGPGHRAGGYVAFWVDVPASVLQHGDAASNELFVLADNRFNHTTAPMHTGGDFWHYGGLTRSVELHTMAAQDEAGALVAGGSVLWRAYVAPSGADPTLPGSVTAPDSVDITLVLSDKTQAGPVSFTVGFDGAAPVAMKGTAEDGEVKLLKLPVPSPKLWSPAAPNLHTLTVTYAGGSVTERFGLRAFGVDNATARVTINGKIEKLVGWNHHTQWPVTAASPTDAQMDADIALLKVGNANYVRGAHYPHDPRMIDRFDEAGILFWSETLGPSVSLQNMQDTEFFMKYQLQQLQQMLDNALNHASIFTWGWFNEGPASNVLACPAYGACNDYARGRDPSRFTTWADDTDLRGRCFEHATLIAFNSYPGWYNSMGSLTAQAEHWNSCANDVRRGKTSGGTGKPERDMHTLGKPFVISETGAGGIFEWSDNGTAVSDPDAHPGDPPVGAKWTLAYQAQVIAADVEVAIANPNISGITLWHFYDFKVDNCGATWPCKHGPGQENDTHCPYDHAPPETFAALKSEGPPNCTTIVVNGRPGGENHKGSVDFWRRPKPAFTQTAAKYGKAQVNDIAQQQQN